jgi:glycosyltransferase involved in cell wall biosynthesis
MDDTIAVTVLIPAWNAAGFIAEAIDSIRLQTFREFELLIVDDGSTDATREIVAARAAEDPRIRLLARPHRGPSAAANAGLAKCRSPIVARMDADDICLPGRLEQQVAWLAQHPEVAAVGGAASNLYPDGRLEPAPAPPLSPDAVRAALASGNCMFNNTVTFRRDALLAAGGYRSAFDTAEDYDLWLRLSERADVANLPEVFVHYRRHPGQVTSLYRPRQDALAELARTAAERRRAGAPDPFDGIDRIDGETIARLGLPRHQERRLRTLLAGHIPGRLPLELMFLRPLIARLRRLGVNPEK